MLKIIIEKAAIQIRNCCKQKEMFIKEPTKKNDRKPFIRCHFFSHPPSIA